MVCSVDSHVADDWPFLPAFTGLLANVLTDRVCVSVLVGSVFVFPNNEVEVFPVPAFKEVLFKDSRAVDFSGDHNFKNNRVAPNRPSAVAMICQSKCSACP